MATSRSSSEATFVTAGNDPWHPSTSGTRSKPATLLTSMVHHSITSLTNRSSDPDILIISLSNARDDFDKDHKVLLQRLADNACVHRATSCYQVVTWLGLHTPDIVLITDGDISKKKQEYKNTWDAVISYMRRGGLAILCGTATADLGMTEDANFFRRAKLLWFVSDACNGAPDWKLQRVDSLPEEVTHTELPKAFPAPSRPVRGVPAREALYLKLDPWSASMAVGRFGEGTLIYVGNSTHSPKTQQALMVFCGFSSPELIHFGPEHDTRVVETILSEDKMSWVIKRADGSEEHCTYERHK